MKPEKARKKKNKKYSNELAKLREYINMEELGTTEYVDACSYISNLEIPEEDKLFLNITMARYLETKRFSNLASKTMKMVENTNQELKNSFINWEINEFHKQKILLRNKRK